MQAGLSSHLTQQQHDMSKTSEHFPRNLSTLRKMLRVARQEGGVTQTTTSGAGSEREREKSMAGGGSHPAVAPVAPILAPHPPTDACAGAGAGWVGGAGAASGVAACPVPPPAGPSLPHQQGMTGKAPKNAAGLAGPHDNLAKLHARESAREGGGEVGWGGCGKVGWGSVLDYCSDDKLAGVADKHVYVLCISQQLLLLYCPGVAGGGALELRVVSSGSGGLLPDASLPFIEALIKGSLKTKSDYSMAESSSGVRKMACLGAARGASLGAARGAPSFLGAARGGPSLPSLGAAKGARSLSDQNDKNGAEWLETCELGESFRKVVARMQCAGGVSAGVSEVSEVSEVQHAHTTCLQPKSSGEDGVGRKDRAPLADATNKGTGGGVPRSDLAPCFQTVVRQGKKNGKEGGERCSKHEGTTTHTQVQSKKRDIWQRLSHFGRCCFAPQVPTPTHEDDAAGNQCGGHAGGYAGAGDEGATRATRAPSSTTPATLSSNSAKGTNNNNNNNSRSLLEGCASSGAAVETKRQRRPVVFVACSAVLRAVPWELLCRDVDIVRTFGTRPCYPQQLSQLSPALCSGLAPGSSEGGGRGGGRGGDSSGVLPLSRGGLCVGVLCRGKWNNEDAASFNGKRGALARNWQTAVEQRRWAPPCNGAEASV